MNSFRWKTTHDPPGHNAAKRNVLRKVDKDLEKFGGGHSNVAASSNDNALGIDDVGGQAS
jgi:hypothetical protein